MIEYNVQVFANGWKYWHLNGELHREDGPAVECANGDKKWYLNDKLHREYGPAIECANGDKKWYLNGKLHREDGPAVERANGDKKWYLNDKLLTEDEFNKAMSPTKELTIGELESMLGYKIKVVGEDK